MSNYKLLWWAFCALSCNAQVALANGTPQEGFSWLGSASLKNNYIFSTGTKIDDKPVFQLWLRGSLNNGFFVDFWGNAPLRSGNPMRSAEMDFSIGYSKKMSAKSTITAMLSYYDIETPKLLDFDNDVLSPVLKWQTGNFYTEGIYFFVDGDRDGYRIENSYTHNLNDRLQLQGKLNFADGPYTNQRAVIGKIAVHYSPRGWWLDRLSIEVNEMLYLENEFDARDFGVTIGLQKNLF